jgi:hypothetical protein
MNVISYPPHIAPLPGADAGFITATESWSTEVLRTAWHWFTALCSSVRQRLHARRSERLNYPAGHPPRHSPLYSPLSSR